VLFHIKPDKTVDLKVYSWHKYSPAISDSQGKVLSF